MTVHAFPRHRLEVIAEGCSSTPQPVEQPSDLHQTLTRAVDAGRRRGFGRRGRCIQCGQPLLAHFSPTRNEFTGCHEVPLS